MNLFCSKLNPFNNCWLAGCMWNLVLVLASLPVSETAWLKNPPKEIVNQVFTYSKREVRLGSLLCPNQSLCFLRFFSQEHRIRMMINTIRAFCSHPSFSMRGTKPGPFTSSMMATGSSMITTGPKKAAKPKKWRITWLRAYSRSRCFHLHLDGSIFDIQMFAIWICKNRKKTTTVISFRAFEFARHGALALQRIFPRGTQLSWYKSSMFETFFPSRISRFPAPAPLTTGVWRTINRPKGVIKPRAAWKMKPHISSPHRSAASARWKWPAGMA